jgi:hypothetical protein
VVIDFRDYTRLNCLRTLPYVQAWAQRYEAVGLQVIGIHTPEYTFGRERHQVELALAELNVAYPVLLDNDFKNWNAFRNRFWPSKYLIDPRGVIRAVHEGEGDYQSFERAIQTVLREHQPDVDLPSLMPPLRPEDDAEARRYRPTPELRGGFNRGALGNLEGYAGGAPLLYSLPDQRRSGAFYVSGAWRADMQHFMYCGSSEGEIRVPYEAVEVNAVLSPHADTVERLINPQTISVEVWQDDQPIAETMRGADLTEDGRLLVNRPRLYNLVRNPGFEQHELTLRVRAPGFALYAFAFGSGVMD